MPPAAALPRAKLPIVFFQNEKVNPVAILGKQVENTLERAKSCHSRVLVIQDTTDLIYTQFPSIKDLGQRLKARVSGLLLRSSFVVSSEGVPLGVLKQTFYTYDEVREKRGQSAVNVRGLNKKVPIEQKVSHQWIDHLSETSRLLTATSSQIVHVADRECDIYEFLQSASDHYCQYDVRSRVSTPRMAVAGRA
jgi:hypothetical protein